MKNRRSSRCERPKSARAGSSHNSIVSKISHDVKTPLNGIIGLNKLIEMSLGDLERTGEYLEKSEITARRLLFHIDNILDASRACSNGLRLAKKPVDLCALADEVILTLSEDIAQAGIDFSCKKSLSEPCVLGDKARLGQILYNLLDNSVKYTPPGGRISLSLFEKRISSGKYVAVFVISDSGPGVPKSVKRRISAWLYGGKFFTRLSEGGLGLPVSCALIRKMGGRITLRSAPGRGSTVAAAIPVEISKKRCEDGECTENIPPEQLSGINILAVDDNPLNAEILYEILSANGFNVTVAGDGEEALRIFSESDPWHFSVIITDMQMPKMGGCDAAKAIRALKRPDAKSVFICAFSANTADEGRAEATACGIVEGRIKGEE